MESQPSSSTAAQQLQDAERHRLQVYASATTPAWAWPSFGVLVFMYFSSFEISITWARIVASVAYAVLTGVWVGMVARCSGVQPRLRGMPRPLQHQVYLCWLVGAVGAGVLVTIGVNTSYVLAGILAGILTAVGGTFYDRRYRRVAAQLSGAAPAS